MKQLLQEIRNCTLCASELPFGARPIISTHPNNRLVIVSQAPGSVVHQNGVAWQDQGGNTLRRWLDLSEDEFYDAEKVGIVPMGFCYPGKGKSGDLPPRKECAPLWHPPVFEQLQKIKLILLVGRYAQQYYLKEQAEKTLTATVKNYQQYLHTFFPLPHPSPRNRFWRQKNPWFEETVVPVLQQHIKSILA